MSYGSKQLLRSILMRILRQPGAQRTVSGDSNAVSPRSTAAQAPEGFYTITPGLMNPNSNYYLAINTGFPNAYDRANDRTGTFLMIHGDCASARCYAMTNEQIAEIYTLSPASHSMADRSRFRSRHIRSE